MVPIPYANKVASRSRGRRIGDDPVLCSAGERQRSEVGNGQRAARWEIRKIRDRHRAGQERSRRTTGIAINTEIYLVRAGAIVLQCGTNLREMGTRFGGEGQGDFKGAAGAAKRIESGYVPAVSAEICVGLRPQVRIDRCQTLRDLLCGHVNARVLFRMDRTGTVADLRG